jgi:hypothetical protein
MASEGLVTGVAALAKHKVAGSTLVTRSRNVAELAAASTPETAACTACVPGQWAARPRVSVG